MNTKPLFYAILAALLLVCAVSLAASAAGEPPAIPWQVFSGGALAASSSYSLAGSLGQAAIGQATSSNHALSGGYWPAARQADLSLSKSAFPDPVQAGSPLTYTLEIHNQGAFSAAGLLLEDQLPAGASFVSASQAGCTHANGLVTCKLGDLPAGGSLSVQIVTTVSLGAPSLLTNSASVHAAQLDPDPGSNQAGCATQVQAGATRKVYLPLVVR
ncbi:MAG: DUF11 domain-containing protein [Anaerolineales bacterium]|nr:DUF11 domain-containing protein [Anaerolineales bacterium]